MVDKLTSSVPIIYTQGALLGTPTKEFMIKWEQLSEELGTIPALSTAAQVSAVLDKITATAGVILYRGTSQWGGLAPGSPGQLLTMVGGFPAWANMTLANIANDQVLANISGSLAAPIGVGVSALLDSVFSSAQGSILYRDSALWKALAPSTNGWVLTTQGAGANPKWAAPAGGSGSGLFSQVMSASTPTDSGTGLTTWLNQNAATKNNGATGLVLSSPNSGSVQLNGLVKAAPATPYTVTALLAKTMVTTSASIHVGGGMGWYDGSNKLHVANIQTDGAAVGSPGGNSYFDIEEWNSATSYNSSPITTAPGPFDLVWLQLKDDGTNFFFNMSKDGVTFQTILTGAKSGGFLGASGYSNICFFVYANGAQSAITLLSYAD